jgi:hypothetical protein
MQTLGVVCNSIADLGIKNEAFYEKVKKVVADQGSRLQALDCAQIMTAFCKIGLFDNELFYLLEKQFYNDLISESKVSLQSVITMYCSHQSWSTYMVETCLEEDKKKR